MPNQIWVKNIHNSYDENFIKITLRLNWFLSEFRIMQLRLEYSHPVESSVYAALLPANTSIKGAYIWHDCQIVDWVNGPTPPMT